MIAMKLKSIEILVVIIGGLLSVLTHSLCIAGESSVSEKKADPAIYQELRNQVLSGSRKNFGLPPTKTPDEPWGVIMDVTFDDGGSYTVVSMIDGNASIYLSSGGGYIGGGDHKIVREAAQAMVTSAKRLQSKMTITTKFPLPKNGGTTFYVLTDKGILTASALENDLGEERHYLSPLFYAAQEVITQYRRIDESKE